MKKLICLGLALMLSTVFVSCSSDDKDLEVEPKLCLDEEGFAKISNPISLDRFCQNAIGGWQQFRQRCIDKDGTIKEYSSLMLGAPSLIEITSDSIYIFADESSKSYFNYAFSYESDNMLVYYNANVAFKVQILSLSKSEMQIISESNYQKLLLSYKRVSQQVLDIWHEKHPYAVWK